jgi:3-phosphoshikimate 1-carboxyvinyltransferase
VPSDLLRPLDSLPDPLPIATIPPDRARAIRSVVRPPGSKSLTNRALLLAALASGESRLHGALTEADDAERMLAALGALGAGVSLDAPGEVAVRGVRGRWPVAHDGVELNLHNAGTATRFLAAASALAAGPVTIDGNERMRQRPIGELGFALKSLGAEVSWGGVPGCPPLTITPPPLNEVGELVTFGRTKSSQFISALLLVAPWLPRGLTIRLEADPTSSSYVSMTLELLARLGASVRSSADLRVVRAGPEAGGPPGLRPFELDIEPDASAATYFWAGAALLPGAKVRIAGLAGASLQGDAGFPDLLARMGARVAGDHRDDAIVVQGSKRLRAILADMEDMPDAAVTLAVLASFAEGTSVLRGVRTLRVKESDRIAALAAELAKIGVHVATDVGGDDDAISITPPASGVDCSSEAGPVEFDTYRDHRIAMALALVGLRRPNVFIRDPGCVDKTFPGYWEEFERFVRAR